jgi:hypothetical protein
MHAILMAADAVRAPFATINADDFYGAQSYRLLAQHLQSGSADEAMVAFTLRNTLSDFGSVARGICRVDDRDYLQTVVELTKIERGGADARNTDAAGHITKLSGGEAVSMNCWGFAPRVFVQLKARFNEFLKNNGGDFNSECYIPHAVNELVAGGQMRVKVLRTNESWFGVTYREDRPRAVASIRGLIASGDYPEKLWP